MCATTAAINGSIELPRDLLLAAEGISMLWCPVVKHKTFPITNGSTGGSSHSNGRLSSGGRSGNGLPKLKSPPKNPSPIEQLLITRPVLRRLSKDPPEIPTFRPFAAPLSPCLIPSALEKEGAKALSFSRPIHEDIRKGHYECLICSDNVGPASHMWSCQICSRVFDLSCIKRKVFSGRCLRVL